MDWIVRLGSLSNSNYYFGFGDTSGHNNLYIQYQAGTGADWYGFARVSDTTTTLDLGVPASNSIWSRLKLRSDGYKTFFSVNGSPDKSICPAGCDATGPSNLGATQVLTVSMDSTTNNSSVTMALDFFAFQITGISR